MLISQSTLDMINENKGKIEAAAFNKMVASSLSMYEITVEDYEVIRDAGTKPTISCVREMRGEVFEFVDGDELFDFDVWAKTKYKSLSIFKNKKFIDKYGSRLNKNVFTRTFLKLSLDDFVYMEEHFGKHFDFSKWIDKAIKIDNTFIDDNFETLPISIIFRYKKGLTLEQANFLTNKYNNFDTYTRMALLLAINSTEDYKTYVVSLLNKGDNMYGDLFELAAERGHMNQPNIEFFEEMDKRAANALTSFGLVTAEKIKRDLVKILLSSHGITVDMLTILYELGNELDYLQKQLPQLAKDLFSQYELIQDWYSIHGLHETVPGCCLDLITIIEELDLVADTFGLDKSELTPILEAERPRVIALLNKLLHVEESDLDDETIEGINSEYTEELAETFDKFMAKWDIENTVEEPETSDVGLIPNIFTDLEKIIIDTVENSIDNGSSVTLIKRDENEKPKPKPSYLLDDEF